MYLGKARIKEMAQYTNRIEETMGQYRGVSNKVDLFTECRGAYFAALKMAELAGVANEVLEYRDKLKEAS